MNDYELNSKASLKDIKDILKKYGIKEDEITTYGKYMAKINVTNPILKGKLILVTSTNPTPYGEGKTTLAIGLCDALNKNGYKSSLALREPSLGPVFGTKGGATGGGMCQVCPMDKINLHFTGDFHAITSANNLIASVIDNHIYWGNKLNIKNVCFERCLDINDRALRNISLATRKEHFNITAASEIMTAFTLAEDINDLKKRIDNIVVGTNINDKDITVKDLDCSGSVVALLKDASSPNAVQTMENNLALIHGGPFANIAHGSNSIIATKEAMSISDYVITEAGFGSDCGALKFLDIKCGEHHIYPSLIIVNTTIRSLKYHGKEDLKKGIGNLGYHVSNMQKFHDNVLVILNKFASDTEEEISFLEDYCKNTLKVEFLISNMYQNGSKDTKGIASKVVDLCHKGNKKTFNVYNLDDDILTKIDKFCHLYNAKEVVYKEGIKEKVIKLGKKYPNYRICISKTPLSISDDKNLLGVPKDYTMTVTDAKVNKAGYFITILMGNVLTMPGLSNDANYKRIDVINNEIRGIF